MESPSSATAASRSRSAEPSFLLQHYRDAALALIEPSQVEGSERIVGNRRERLSNA